MHRTDMPTTVETNRTSLETRQLGNSDLKLTPIGFGAWAIGGGNWDFGWGPQDDRESVEAIQRALEGGMNWIDTAAIYGLGHSEEIVAKALAHCTKKPYVFTKCSMRWDENRRIYRSLKKDSLREEVENSLRRLKLDVIDLYQIHWPDPEAEIEEGWETLARFKEEGKVRYIGVSNFNVEQMERAMKIAPITSLQPPYSLLDPAVEEEILPFCKAHNIGVINYSPMASGLLSGQDDGRTHCQDAGGRLAAPRSAVQRAEALAQLEAGGVAARDRQRAPGATGRGGDCLDVAQSGGDRSHCGRAQSQPGGRDSYRRRRSA